MTKESVVPDGDLHDRPFIRSFSWASQRQGGLGDLLLPFWGDRCEVEELTVDAISTLGAQK